MNVVRLLALLGNLGTLGLVVMMWSRYGPPQDKQGVATALLLILSPLVSLVALARTRRPPGAGKAR